MGQRAAFLLARQGAKVRVSSRSLDRAKETCDRIAAKVGGANLTPLASDAAAALDGAQVAIAAGAAGVELVSKQARQSSKSLKVAIDLNAVPPVGIAGVEIADKAKERDGLICYGAIGVGGTKMKIHRAAIQTLFTANNLVLDAEQVFEIGQNLS